MNHSMAQPDSAFAPLELSGWKTAVNWVAAILIAALFLVSGLWKITDAPGAAVRMAQARVPEALSLPAALFFGITETFAGVMLLVPRFRRWGAWLGGVLLVAFMAYIGVNYQALRGAECNCFPWIKRMVGPAFFIGDAVMLGLAVLAGWWTRRPQGLRGASLVLAAVGVFAFVSYGVAAVRQSGVKAPDFITVAGQPYSLQHGKILIYFFDPECMHCFDAAQKMSALRWDDTRVVGVPVGMMMLAPGFLQQTGLKAVLSPDLAPLRKVFPFVDAPAAVALEDGHEKAALTKFDGPEPQATLRKLGFVE